MASELVYGLADPADLASMSGRELLQAMIEGRVPAPSIAGPMNFRLVEVGEGEATFEGVPTPQLLNPLGSVHGGWALTLIDSAAGCAAHSLLPAGVAYTTVETKANFTRAIAPDGKKVRAYGKVLSHGRQIITAEARMETEEGKLVAHGTSTLMVLRRS